MLAPMYWQLPQTPSALHFSSRRSTSDTISQGYGSMTASRLLADSVEHVPYYVPTCREHIKGTTAHLTRTEEGVQTCKRCFINCIGFLVL